MAKQDHVGATPSWRPWQLSSGFVIPLIFVALAVFAALEALVQVGNAPFDDADLRSSWLDWYCEGQEDAQNCIPLPMSIPFVNSSSSKTGLLTFQLVEDIAPSASFAWLYLPTILAVLYGILWQIVDDETKRLEPFYQTQRPCGATAASSLFASYISVPPILVPLQAIRWRQSAVFLSSVTYVLVGFVTPILQSQMFQIQPQAIQVRFADDSSLTGYTVVKKGEPFDPRPDLVGAFVDGGLPPSSLPLFGQTDEGKLQSVVYLDPTYARAQEAVLLLAAVTASLLLWTTTRRRRTIVLRDSMDGLGTLASLAQPHSDFLAEMAPLAEAKNANEAKYAEKRLAHRVVHLGSGSGGGRSETQHRGYGFWFEPDDNAGNSSPNPASARSAGNTSCAFPYFTLRAANFLIVIALLYFTIHVIVYANTEKPEPARLGTPTAYTSYLDDSISVAAENLILVSVVKSVWVVVEEHITSLSHFRSLYRRPQPAFPVFFRDYASVPILARTYYAFRDGELIFGAVTVVSVLMELELTLFGIETSMDQGQARNRNVLFAMQWLVVAISGIMFGCASKLLHALLKGYIVVARNPETLGARLSYLCKSPQLLSDFAGVAAMNNEEKGAHLRAMPLQYSLRQLHSSSSRDGEPLEIQAVERVG